MSYQKRGCWGPGGLHVGQHSISGVGRMDNFLLPGVHGISLNLLVESVKDASYA